MVINRNLTTASRGTRQKAPRPSSGAFSPRKRAVVVLIESAKADEVLKSIYRQLREACKGQFTKTRPGHLAVQFQDLTAEQMEGLARDGASADSKPIGLQAMTTALLQSANRCYIHDLEG